MDKKLLFTAIDQKAAERKDKIAISSGDSLLTYAELVFNSDRIARQLLGSGLRKGEVVGVYMSRSISYVVTVLGINKAGGVFMPLEVNYPPDRLTHLLNHVQPACIIIENEYKNNFEKFVSTIAAASRFGCNENYELLDQNGSLVPESAVLPQLNGDDSCYLIYTSGSTGTPKVIEGVHKSLSHFIHWEVSEFNLDASTKVGLVAPLSFDVSFRDIFVPLLAGGTLYLPSPNLLQDIPAFLNWIQQSQLTLLHVVPSVFRLITSLLKSKQDTTSIDSLTHILLAGEPLYGRDVLQWREAAGDKATLVNLYGPSETTLAKLFFRIPSSAVLTDGVLPLGSPLPNTTIAIINNGRLCNIGDAGEIYIKTPFCSKGYYKNPELTQSSFIQNPLHNDFHDIVYKTGDWGKYLPGRQIAFTGRQDAQVKIRGNRVEMPEVENCIVKFPGIEHAVVVALEAKDKSMSLACYYTENKKITIVSLQEYIRKQLPGYMMPSYFVRLDNFPLNLNGKINKKALPRPEEMLYDELEYQAPATILEEKIATIWGEMLGLKKVGVTNTFFELGGHSLIATRIVSKITIGLNRDLSLKEFFENSTIQKLASFLLFKEEKQQDDIPVVPIDTGSLYDISYTQKRILLASNRSVEKNLYNMPLAFRFMGKLDVIAFKQAFESIIDRHESMRTTFHEVQGEMKQKVHRDIGFAILEIESNEQQELQVTRRLVDELINEEFDLEKGPLFSGKLVKFNPAHHLFLFNIHHIISDGWSLGVLFKEFVALYNREVLGTAAGLPALPVQYKDYVYWIKNKVAEGKFSDSGKFWHSLLANVPNYSPGISDFPKTMETGHEGSKHTFDFSAAASEQVRNFCREHEISLASYLLSVIYVLLFRNSGLKQITIGIPVAGRIHPDLYNQLGNYMNNLVLPVDIREEELFTDFLQRANQIALAAYDHQGYPYDLLVEDRRISANWQNPFYSTLVVINNDGLLGENDDLAWMAGDVKIESVKIEENISKLDLSFFCYDKPEIGVAIEYNVELFKKETPVNMESVLHQLNQLIMQNPRMTIYDLVSKVSGDHEKELKQKIVLENTGTLNEIF